MCVQKLYFAAFSQSAYFKVFEFFLHKQIMLSNNCYELVQNLFGFCKHTLFSCGLMTILKLLHILNTLKKYGAHLIAIVEAFLNASRECRLNFDRKDV